MSLPPEDLLVSFRSPKTCLPIVWEENDLKGFVLNPHVENVGRTEPNATKQLPLGILIILGSENDDDQRQQVTNHVICYFEQNFKTVWEHDEMLRILGYSPISNNNQVYEKPGIFLWPKAYLSPSQDTSLLLIAFVNSSSSVYLANFLVLAASKVIVYDLDGMNRFNTLFEPNKSTGVLESASSTLVSVTIPKRKVNIQERQDIFSVLQNLGSLRKRTFSKETLTSRNLHNFLQDINNYLKSWKESASPAPGKGAVTNNPVALSQRPATSNATVTSQPTATSQQIATSKPTATRQASVTRQTSCNEVKTKVPKTTMPTKGQNDNDQTSSSSSQKVACTYLDPCRNHLCLLLDKTFSEMVQLWISQQTENFDVSRLLEIKEEMKKSDHHNIYEDIINAFITGLEIFNDIVRSKFDNYLCYSSETDTNDLKKSAEEAYQTTARAFKPNRTSNQRVQVFIDSYFEACNTLYKMYKSHNTTITAQEKLLAEKVFNTVTEEYKRIITDRIKFETELADKTNSTLDKFNERLINNCLSVVRRSLDFSGKLDNELSQRTKPLKGILQEFFMQMKALNGLIKSPPTVPGIVGHGLQQYVSLMYQGSNRTLSPERHCDILNKIRSSITDETLRQEVTLRLNTSFSHSIDIALEQQEKAQTIQQIHHHPICMHFSDKHIQVGAIVAGELKLIHCGTDKKPSTLPLLAFVSPDKISLGERAMHHIQNSKSVLSCYGIVNNLLTRTAAPSEGNFLATANTLLFQLLRSDAEISLNSCCLEVVIIIPTWFNSFHRQNIRSLAKQVGFLKIFLVHEASVAALTLQNHHNASSAEPLIIAVVCRTIAGISVMLYEKIEQTPSSQNQPTSIRQIAISSSPNYNNFNFCPNDSLWDCKIKNWVYGIKEIIHPNILVQEEGHLDKIFNDAYQQLGPTRKQCKLKFIYFTDNHAYDEAFQRFVAKLKVDWYKGEELVMNEGIRLTRKTSILRDLIHDEGMYIDKERFEGNGSYKSDSVTESKLSDDLENVGLDGDEQSLQNKESEERRNILVKKCNAMKEQLEAGTVRIIGNLMKKITNEAVERAIETATNAYSTEEQIEFEEKEIDDLIRQHKFNVN